MLWFIGGVGGFMCYRVGVAWCLGVKWLFYVLKETIVSVCWLCVMLQVVRATILWVLITCCYFVGFVYIVYNISIIDGVLCGIL